MHGTLEREVVFLTPGVLTDAGGYEIIIVGGKVIVKPVPGWGVEARGAFNAALSLLAAAKAVENREMREQLHGLAHTLLQSQAAALGAYAANGNAGYSGMRS